METQKVLTLTSLVIAGLVVLIFLFDAALGFPFQRKALVLDILLIVGGAFVVWQALETYRELR